MKVVKLNKKLWTDAIMEEINANPLECEVALIMGCGCGCGGCGGCCCPGLCCFLIC